MAGKDEASSAAPDNSKLRRNIIVSLPISFQQTLALILPLFPRSVQRPRRRI